MTFRVMAKQLDRKAMAELQASLPVGTPLLPLLMQRYGIRIERHENEVCLEMDDETKYIMFVMKFVN